jgi:anhydro-N-acetylmuramic acid kinase
MAGTASMIGLMSGTSVDGLDIAYCLFGPKNEWEILAAQTVKYPPEMRKNLEACMRLNPVELTELDARLGLFFGNEVNKFLKRTGLPKPGAIASHGHTVFHNPAKQYTLQIGKGSHLAAVTGIKVVCDFRSTDVAHGGQGAPLVPIGDELLFGQYDYCLNLGGFANVSFNQKNKRVAFDVCPCNLPVNLLMQKQGKEFDRNGETGKKGKIIPSLLKKLEALPHYRKKGPKSLGREWVETEIMPLLAGDKNTANVLRTYYEHVAMQLARVISKKGATVLVTGGGTHNRFLMQLFHQKSNAVLVTPQPELIDFKEALVFAYLGYLRLNGKVNALKSVTGAKKDSIGGAVYV